MARTRSLPVWALAVWALCLLAGTADHMAGDQAASGRRAPLGETAVLDPAGDHAALPARVADEVRVADHAGPVRGLMVAAVLAMLVGGPATLRRRASLDAAHLRHLRFRRYTIALRAPPLQLA